MTQIDKIDSKTQGRWTKQEHQKFLQGMQLYGKDWKKIQEFIQTRNGAQIRSHAQKFFLRMKKQINLSQYSSEHQDIQIKKNPLQIKQNIERQSQESNNYSYFIGKIIQLSNQNMEFDFWHTLIDQRSCEDSNDIETGITKKRKSSFSACEQSDDMCKKPTKPSKKLKVD